MHPHMFFWTTRLFQMHNMRTTKVIFLKLVKHLLYPGVLGSGFLFKALHKHELTRTCLFCYNKLHTEVEKRWSWQQHLLWSCISCCENTHKGKHLVLCLKMKTRLAGELSKDLAWQTLANTVFEEARYHNTSLSYPLGIRAPSSCV